MEVLNIYEFKRNNLSQVEQVHLVKVLALSSKENLFKKIIPLVEMNLNNMK